MKRLLLWRHQRGCLRPHNSFLVTGHVMCKSVLFSLLSYLSQPNGRKGHSISLGASRTWTAANWSQEVVATVWQFGEGVHPYRTLSGRLIYRLPLAIYVEAQKPGILLEAVAVSFLLYSNFGLCARIWTWLHCNFGHPSSFWLYWTCGSTRRRTGVAVAICFVVAAWSYKVDRIRRILVWWIYCYHEYSSGWQTKRFARRGAGKPCVWTNQTGYASFLLWKKLWT